MQLPDSLGVDDPGQPKNKSPRNPSLRFVIATCMKRPMTLRYLTTSLITSLFRVCCVGLRLRSRRRGPVRKETHQPKSVTGAMFRFMQDGQLLFVLNLQEDRPHQHQGMSMSGSAQKCMVVIQGECFRTDSAKTDSYRRVYDGSYLGKVPTGTLGTDVQSRRDDT
jgi:hypothetical protein